MNEEILAALENELNGSSPPPEKKNKRKTIHNAPPPDDDQEETLFTLQDKKTAEEVRKLKIGNEKELNNLFSRELMQSIMAEISHSIQVNFVDLARRESPTLAAKWGVPEKERDVEKDIGDIIGGSIEAVINNIESLVDDGVFK